MRRCCTIAAVLVTLLVASTSAARRDTRLMATEVRTYSLPEDDPMALPTDVVVGINGHVFVADGVNDRVVEFAPDGSLVRSIEAAAGRSLANPTAVSLSADGRLWIADCDNRRVVVISGQDEGVEVEIDPEVGLDGLDLTGLAVSPDGVNLWLVDNQSHRMLRGNLETGLWEEFGSLGEAWGQLRYPFHADCTAEGGVVVTDGINGRVQGWAVDGRPSRPIGRYGVTPGRLFRPKGIAVGPAGHTWVADSTLGVIQVFGSRGQLLDVVQDEAGEPLRLDEPVGIDVAGDRLFVVELRRHAVREFLVAEAPGRPARPARAQNTGSGDGCTICHLEFMPTYVDGLGATALRPAPASTEQQPYVSTDASCMGCHDGLVDDDRKRVWTMHGHSIGEAPPEDMVIPEELPLADGKMACRTCHSPHTMGGSGQEHRNAMFLRVTDDAEELCLACHGDLLTEGAK
jgi:DNA-binding beta-propeller fold protein YncE